MKRMPSVLSDKTPCDPHHWPESRAALAGDGLLEMIPLTREEHDKATAGDPWTLSFIEANAPAHLKRVYATYNGGNHYLGPLELVKKYREEVMADVKMRRQLLGIA